MTVEREKAKWMEDVLPHFVVMGMQHKMNRLGHFQSVKVVAHFRDAVTTELNALTVGEKTDRQRELIETANAMTADHYPGDERNMMLACLSFPPLLLDNGLWDHAETAEVCHKEIEMAKQIAGWSISEQWVSDTAEVLLHRARLMGYYWDPSA